MALSLKDLAEIVGTLDGRVATLEQYVASNDARISVIEGRQRTGLAGVARANEDMRRDRWLRTLRGRR